MTNLAAGDTSVGSTPTRSGNAGDRIPKVYIEYQLTGMTFDSGAATSHSLELAMAAGTTRIEYSVATEQDHTDEDNGLVTVTLRDPDFVGATEYTLGSSDSATVVVEDDDTVPAARDHMQPPPRTVYTTLVRVTRNHAERGLLGRCRFVSWA